MGAVLSDPCAIDYSYVRTWPKSIGLHQEAAGPSIAADQSTAADSSKSLKVMWELRIACVEVTCSLVERVAGWESSRSPSTACSIHTSGKHRRGSPSNGQKRAPISGIISQSIASYSSELAAFVLLVPWLYQIRCSTNEQRNEQLRSLQAWCS